MVKFQTIEKHFGQVEPAELKVRWKAVNQSQLKPKVAVRSPDCGPKEQGVNGAKSPTFCSNQHVQSPHKTSHEKPALVKCVPSSNTESLALRLAHRLHSTAETGYSLAALGEYLPHLPAHIGRSAALDAATECMLIIHGTRTNYRSTDHITELRAYGTAIHALKGELHEAGRNPSPETLCAALAHCNIEVRKCARPCCVRIALTMRCEVGEWENLWSTSLARTRWRCRSSARSVGSEAHQALIRAYITVRPQRTNRTQTSIYADAPY